MTDTVAIGSRGAACVGQAGYKAVHSKAKLDLYDRVTNPDGWISFAVAENRLNWAMLRDKIHTMISESTAEECFPLGVSSYSKWSGIPEFAAAIADVFQRNIIFDEIDASKLTITSGCMGALVATFSAILDRDDAVIIPTPLYPGFIDTTKILPGCHQVFARTYGPDYAITRDILDEAYTRAISEGEKVRAVLISNPCNPLGMILTPTELWDVICWCREKRIHFVCDEIYAGSMFLTPEEIEAGKADPSRTSFMSVLKLCNQGGPDGTGPKGLTAHEHITWGLSKDFAICGFRVGMAYNVDDSLNAALNTIGAALSVSNFCQVVMTRVLRDKEFIDDYLFKNRLTLTKIYEVFCEGMKELDVPFCKPDGTMYCWIDLRKYLSDSSAESQYELWKAIVDECKVVMIHGGECCYDVPGYFRLCYSWMDEDALKEAFRRMKKLFDRLKKSTPPSAA